MSENSKKEICLFLNFNTTKHVFFDMALEQIKVNQVAGNEVYVLKCNKQMYPYCCTFRYNYKREYCTLCKKTFYKGHKLLKVPKDHIIPLKNVKKLKLPEFSTIEEIKKYSINGWNIGFGAASTTMSYTRDHMFNPKENRKLVDGLINNAYLIAENLDRVIKEINPDKVYLFNGRYSEYYGAVEVCRKTNIEFYVYESGADFTRYRLVKNTLPHDKVRIQTEMNEMWNNKNISYEDKVKVIEDWNYNKRNCIEKNWHSYTKKQEKGKLPFDFDKSKENIVIFNSSMDESAIFDDYQSPIDQNDSNIIKTIVEHFIDDDTKHFYLRVHPHLKNRNNTQMKEIKNELVDKYKNLTVILPEEDIDSYAIMENCDKVLIFHSTIGIEAAYAGIPTILVGKPPYDNLDCTYNANTYEEVFDIINIKDLQPKPKENSYPYIYWMNSFGTKFKYYKPKKLFRGKIFGLDLKSIKVKPFDYIKYQFFR